MQYYETLYNTKQYIIKGAYMQEEWRDIKGFEGLYQVSNLGRVKSLDRIDNNNRIRRGRILKPSMKKSGYVHIILHKKGNPYYLLLHRIVAEAFIPNPNNLPQVNHINEDKSINSSDNLEWITSKDNINFGNRTKKAIAHSKKKPIYAIDSEHNISKFSSIHEACRELNLYPSCVCHCLKGRLNTTGGYSFRYAVDRKTIK